MIISFIYYVALFKICRQLLPTMQCSQGCPGWMFSLHTFGWLSQTVRIGHNVHIYNTFLGKLISLRTKNGTSLGVPPLWVGVPLF